jgi:hypothetical protein
MRTALLIGGLSVLLGACGSDTVPAPVTQPEDVVEDASIVDVVEEAEVVDVSDSAPVEDVTEPEVDADAPEITPVEDVAPEVLDVPDDEDVIAEDPDLFAQGNKPAIAIQIAPAVMETLEKAWEDTVEAVVTIDGETLNGVGITLIKTSKNIPSIAAKPRIHLSFDAVDPEQRFQGYRGLWLHELSRDPSKVAEVLGYSLFRAADLPAPKAVHTWLQINEEDRGLYVVVEPYGDPVFVQRYEEDPSAPVYGAPSKLDLVGDQLESFSLEHGVDEERVQLTELSVGLDQLEQEPPEDVLAALGALFDLDAYLTFAATEVVLGHKQGYTQNRQRYALMRGSNGLWRFIPYGLDRIFKGNVNPLNADGRVHKICMNNLACRWAVADAYQEVANRVASLALADQVDTARPYILAMAEADPFIEEVASVESGLDHAESFLNMNPGWVLANLDCLDPTFIDKDGDGYNGCGEDCDDENPDQHPGAPEVCNLFDDDCDGAPDNNNDECETCVLFDSSWGTTYELCFNKMHYQPAREYCQLGGGDLAIVDQLAKQDELVDAVLGVWWTDWWIGLDDIVEEGVYTWVDGTPLDWAQWANNEPNNSGNEDCNHFASWAGGSWNDIPCDQDLAFICEYPSGE